MAAEAGLAFAVIATADLCFKYGKILVETCATFQGAEAEINERIICVRSHWKRTSIQLDFLKRIWRSLDEEHQEIQNQILQILIGKLNNIISQLEKLSTKNSGDQAREHQGRSIKRWKYLLVKQCLDEGIESLASWQKMFDPSWFLIMKISSPSIDEELSRNGSPISTFSGARSLRDALREVPLQKVSVFLPKEGLETSQTHEIAFSSAKCVQRTGSDKWVVIDPVPCDFEIDIGLVTKDVRELATKLSTADPFTFGILQCRGVVRGVEPTGKPSSFDFVFRIPKELSTGPRSLRDYISSHVDHTLSDRFDLAKQLARSVSYVHTLGFVHKNIRPETILGFQTNQSSFGLFVLVGFEKFRTADGRTRRSGDLSWERNLYRHPQRQGLDPEEIYTMQHDIYSLGVCLLEIGLWESFLLYGDGVLAPVPAASLRIASDGAEFGQPILMKEYLVTLAKRDLPKRMGERYQEIVVNCLTCLDRENVDFGDQSEFEDVDGILVGVRYIEKILLKLGEIRV